MKQEKKIKKQMIKKNRLEKGLVIESFKLKKLFNPFHKLKRTKL